MSTSSGYCVVKGCTNLGAHYFGGSLLCHVCYKIAKENTTMYEKECCIAGCPSPGIYCLNGRWYCYTCWKEEGKEGRPSPQQTLSTRVGGQPDLSPDPDPDVVIGDAIRASAAGILVDPANLPTISKNTMEECKKELEMAKRRGYKKEE